MHGAYDAYRANITGLENHQPLVVAAAAGAEKEQLPFSITAPGVYTEYICPAEDGNGVLLQLVNAGETAATVNIKNAKIWQSNLLEKNIILLNNPFTISPRGVMMVRVANEK